MEGRDYVKYGWIVLVCFLSEISVFAQYSVSGQLQSEQQEKLQGATVIFLRNDSLVAGTVSNEKGMFEFKGLPEATYLVRYSLLGYKGKEETLTVKKDLRLGAIVLEEDAHALSEVTVDGDKRNIITTQAGSSTFLISEKLKNSVQNAYQALREIPLLRVDETNRKISMSDGSSPIILINGIRRPGVIESLDPKNIESVEVIDNPSSRYLGEEGVSYVLNFKMKRSVELSQSVNVYGKQQTNLNFGVYGSSYMLEKEKLSFNLNTQFFYFHQDDSDKEGWSNTGDLYRTMSGTQRYNSKMLYVSAGGDWLLSDRDYIAYNASFTTNPTRIKGMESGLQLNAGGEGRFSISSRSDDSYLVGDYNLYYRRTFTSDRHLELTGRAGHYNVSPGGWREETGDWGSYSNEIDMDNRRTTYALEANYDFVWPEKLKFNVGANTYFQKARIEDQSGLFPYKEGREYIYGDLRNAGQSKFSYMVSLGLDIVFRNSDGAKKTYTSFLPALSLSYKLNPKSTLRLNVDRKRTSPNLGNLNPRNTSTDSLNIRIGNPYLLPVLSDKVALSYIWNHKSIYLQPSVSYTYIENNIMPVGELIGNVYKQSYKNMNQAHSWALSLNSRVNLGKYGNINISPYLRKLNMPDMSFNGNSWGVNMNLYLEYKKLSFNGMFWYSNYTYTKISRQKSAPMTELTLDWSLPKGWRVNVGIRDNMHASQNWTIDGKYSSYNKVYNKDRRWTPMIGFNYYFRNKSNVKYRNKKWLNSNESDDFKIKTQ